MVTMTTTAERREGVTLVTATIASDAANGRTRVRVEPRLDGPVWPPRRQGEPAAGWDGDGFEGTVPADGRLAIGFASPASPADPPLEVTSASAATDADGALDAGVDASDADGHAMDTPTAVVRGLGDPSPPSLIPANDATESDSAHQDDEGERNGDGDDGAGDGDREAYGDQRRGTVDAGEGERNDHGDHIAERTRRDTTRSVGNDRDDTPPADDEPLPAEVAAVLSAIDGRVERAEELDADASVEAAAEALAGCGGVAGARALEERLRADARTLRTIQRRAGALAERAEEASVATDALDRLA